MLWPVCTSIWLFRWKREIDAPGVQGDARWAVFSFPRLFLDCGLLSSVWHVTFLSCGLLFSTTGTWQLLILYHSFSYSNSEIFSLKSVLSTGLLVSLPSFHSKHCPFKKATQLKSSEKRLRKFVLMKIQKRKNMEEAFPRTRNLGSKKCSCVSMMLWH